MRAVALGVLMGGAVLTRHVGLALVAAICVDLWGRGRRREVGVALTAVALVLRDGSPASSASRITRRSASYPCASG